MLCGCGNTIKVVAVETGKVLHTVGQVGILKAVSLLHDM